MTMLPLQRWDTKSRLCVHWTRCLPFLENRMAVLIHRPRSVTTYKIGNRRPHIGVGNWCGNHMSGAEKFAFLPLPPEDRIVCARCEEKAVAAGLPTSDQLAGRHVHKGGVVAVRHCCGEDKA